MAPALIDKAVQPSRAVVGHVVPPSGEYSILVRNRLTELASLAVPESVGELVKMVLPLVLTLLNVKLGAVVSTLTVRVMMEVLPAMSVAVNT